MTDSHHTPEPKNVISAPLPRPTAALSHRGGSPGKAPEQTMTPGFVLGALRQWWKIATPAALILATVGASLVWYDFEPEYQASVWLQINELTPYIAFQSQEQSKQFVETQKALLKSPMVLGPVVADAEIRKVLPELSEESNPIEWLTEQIEVHQRNRESEIWLISLKNPSQKGVALVVNAVVEKYLALLVQQEKQQNNKVLQLLEEARSRRSAEVTLLRKNIRNLTQQATGKDPYTVDPAEEYGTQRPILANLQNRLTTAEIEQEVALANQRLFLSQLIGNKNSKVPPEKVEGLLELDAEELFEQLLGDQKLEIPVDKIELLVANDPRVQESEALRNAMREQLQEIASISKKPSQSPGYRRLLEEIDGKMGRPEAFEQLVVKIGQLLKLDRPAEGKEETPERKKLLREIVRLCPDDELLEKLKTEVQTLRGIATNSEQGKDSAKFKEKSAAISDQYTGDVVLACIHTAVRNLLDIKAKSARGEDDSDYRDAFQELKDNCGDTGTLALLKAGLRQQLIAQMKAKFHSDREQEFALLKQDLERYKIEKKLFRERFEEELKNVKGYSLDILEMGFKQAELERAQDVLVRIAQRKLAIDDRTRAPRRVSLLRSAEKPNAPIELIPYKLLTLAVVGGLFFPFLLAVGWERVLQRVNSPHQLERDSDMIVIGETPRLPVRPHGSRRSGGRNSRRNLGIFEESIDGVRTCLMLSEPLQDFQVLAVTSATKKEGKTSVASQLAVSIARATGTPTLLVDGDMRSPDIHNIFDIPLEPGLAEVMTSKCELDEAIAKDWSEYVHLLPAGKLRVNPHKLMGNGKVKKLFDELRSRYRYIVIDTPPVLAASEALVLAKTADASLLCAMQDRSRLDQVRKGYGRLLAAGARPAGTVLNGVPVKRYTYRYGDYAYDQD